MYSFSKFEHLNARKYYKHERPLSQKFKVFVNGKEAPVYTCRISKYPFNTVWPGHQRPFNQTEEAAFVNIVSDEEIKIEVETNIEHEKVLIKPYSKGIAYSEENGRIAFTLSENGDYALQCDSYHNMLYIFNSKPIAPPKSDEVTYYFGPGVYFTGKLTLKSNESIYVDKDALIYGCVYAENAENIHVFGNGIFDDSHEERTGNYCYEEYVNGNMRFYECRGIRIEGVGMTCSAEWCLSLFGCYDAVLDGIKIFGQWKYNSDGVDVVNSQDISVKNSFLHSFDDTVSIKGIDRYYYIDNRNIHIENCVLWCDWGVCCRVGVETACREYNNISFKSCDILRGGSVAFTVDNGDCAEISDIAFENINVEFNSFDTCDVYQENDDMLYGAENTQTVPRLINFNNGNWRSPQNIELWGLPPLTDEIKLDGIKARNIHDVTVKNINVYYDNDLPLTDGKPEIKIDIWNEVGTEPFENISISDINVINREADSEVKG